MENIYGILVVKNIIVINYDYYLMYYLDFDIDGNGNFLVKVKLKMVRVIDVYNKIFFLRKSYWMVVKEMVKMEVDGRVWLGLELVELLIVNL